MRLYRPVSLCLCIIFAVVGLLFLFFPDNVLEFFNTLSDSFNMSRMPVQGTGFYTLLAVGYMYLVSALAFLMYRHPEDRRFPLLLTNGKLATSILSLALFLVDEHYLIYITNFVVDGFIGIVVLLFYLKMKKQSK
jgi:hypothetical protein